MRNRLSSATVTVCEIVLKIDLKHGICSKHLLCFALRPDLSLQYSIEREVERGFFGLYLHKVQRSALELQKGQLKESIHRQFQDNENIVCPYTVANILI